MFFYQLRNRLEFIQEELNRSLRVPMKSPYSGNVVICLVQLSKLKKIYSQLWIIKLEFNNRFNWTVCSGLVALFCKTAVGFYWVLMRIIFNHLSGIGR